MKMYVERECYIALHFLPTQSPRFVCATKCPPGSGPISRCLEWQKIALFKYSLLCWEGIFCCIEPESDGGNANSIQSTPIQLQAHAESSCRERVLFSSTKYQYFKQPNHCQQNRQFLHILESTICNFQWPKGDN